WPAPPGPGRSVPAPVARRSPSAARSRRSPGRLGGGARRAGPAGGRPRWVSALGRGQAGRVARGRAGQRSGPRSGWPRRGGRAGARAAPRWPRRRARPGPRRTAPRPAGRPGPSRWSGRVLPRSRPASRSAYGGLPARSGRCRRRWPGPGEAAAPVVSRSGAAGRSGPAAPFLLRRFPARQADRRSSAHRHPFCRAYQSYVRGGSAEPFLDLGGRWIRHSRPIWEYHSWHCHIPPVDTYHVAGRILITLDVDLGYLDPVTGQLAFQPTAERAPLRRIHRHRLGHALLPSSQHGSAVTTAGRRAGFPTQPRSFRVSAGWGRMARTGGTPMTAAPEPPADPGSGPRTAPAGHDPESVLAALDPEQRQVALAARGPVCVLAGAGTGKTRAVAHRIAYAGLTGMMDPAHVLALTFTTRAAGELRARLAQLGGTTAGLDRVQARTFHSAALRQLTHFWPQTVGGRPPAVLDSKISLLSELSRGQRVGASP